MILYQQQKEFLDNCLDLLDANGTIVTDVLFGIESKCSIYEDNLIKIIKSNDDQRMVMTRKRTESPFFMFNEGITIRFHHEYVFLEEHIINLLKGNANVRQ